jgi:Mg-chelatase subunit ChlD
MALYELPCSRRRGAAVALVIDTSSSMLEQTRAGRTKLAAAVDSAAGFIDVLTFPQDQAAVIGFSGTAKVGALSGDSAQLRRELAALETAPGTDIAAGVRAAQAELMSPRRHPDNFPAMVLITDGQAGDGPAPGIRAADEAKAEGTYIFTIGLGDTIDRSQLQTMASQPEWFYEAATADDLAAVYRAIAVDLPCPASRYWGRR